MQTVPRLPGERNWFTLAPHKEELPVDLKALRLSEDSFLPLCRSIWAKQQKVAEAHNHRVSFLRLLPEIRNRICNLVFLSTPVRVGRDRPDLLLVCRQIYAESNSLYYATTQFHVEAQDVLAAWLRSLPQQRRGLIAEIRTWARFCVDWYHLDPFYTRKEGYECVPSPKTAMRDMYAAISDMPLRPNALKVKLSLGQGGMILWTGRPEHVARFVTIAARSFTAGHPDRRTSFVCTDGPGRNVASGLESKVVATGTG